MPLTLFAFVQERNSWRPKLIVLPHKKTVRFIGVARFSSDGRYLNLRPIIQANSPLFYEVETQRTLVINNIRGRSPIAFVNSHSFTFRSSVYSLPDAKLIAQCPVEMLFLGESFDGKTLCGQPYDIDENENIYLWDFRSAHAPQRLKSLPPSPNKELVRHFELLNDKRTLVVHDYLAHDYPDDDPTLSSADKKSLQLARQAQVVWFYDIFTQKRVFSVPGRSLSPSHSTTLGLCAWQTAAGTLEIWDYKIGRRLYEMPYPRDESPTLSPDGSLLANEKLDTGIINLRDAKSGRLLRTLEGHSSGIKGVDFSPDGHTLATTGDDGTIKLWRIK